MELDSAVSCQVVLKSQILAGGRGLGKFKNGLQGGVHIVNVDKVQELGEQMLNQVLVTKQTGAAGKPVNTLYLAAKMQLTNEMYFAILLDRSTAGPMMIGCSEGGTSIEDLAEKYPEKIIKIPVDIREGITDAQANEMVDGLQVTTDKKAAAEQIKNLYNMFTSCDCTMVEVRSNAHCLWTHGLMHSTGVQSTCLGLTPLGTHRSASVAACHRSAACQYWSEATIKLIISCMNRNVQCTSPQAAGICTSCYQHQVNHKTD